MVNCESRSVPRKGMMQFRHAGDSADRRLFEGQRWLRTASEARGLKDVTLKVGGMRAIADGDLNNARCGHFSWRRS